MVSIVFKSSQFLFYLIKIKMSILDQEQTIQVPANLYKIKYLKSEIQILKEEQQITSTLQDKLKSIMRIISVQQSEFDSYLQRTQNRQIFDNVIQLKEFLIQKVCLLQNQEYQKNNDSINQQSKQSNFQIFNNIVHSLKQSLKKYQQELKKRQIQLQSIEQQNQKILNQQLLDQAKQVKKPLKKQKKLTNSVKSIQTYDINTKLLQFIKKQIVFLKIKKRKLSQISQIQSSANNYRKYKNAQFGKVQTHAVENRRQELSAFQKTVQIYKKNKVNNDLLQQNIQRLKKMVEKKRQQNQILKNKQVSVKKAIQSLDWDQNIDFEYINVEYKNRFVVGCNYSFLNRTDLKTKNYQESFQKSRFLVNQSIIRPN